MSSIDSRRSGRRLAIGLMSGAAILGTVAAAHAQDGRSFFDMLFGAPAQPQQQAPATRVRERPALYGFGREARESRRRRRSNEYAQQQRPKTRYAALPKAETIKADPDKIIGKQPVDQKAILDNPTKAILEDKTLRPGDIVIMPSGPKVFKGGSEKRHRIGEFEDVKHSRLVSKKTRQLLLAMMVPVGALPADQARKIVAMKRRLAHPDEIAAVEARNTSTTADASGESASETPPLRVIVPWKPEP